MDNQPNPIITISYAKPGTEEHRHEQRHAWQETTYQLLSKTAKYEVALLTGAQLLALLALYQTGPNNGPAQANLILSNLLLATYLLPVYLIELDAGLHAKYNINLIPKPK